MLGEGYCWEFVPSGRLVLTELGRMEASVFDKEEHIVQRKDEGWHAWCVLWQELCLTTFNHC